MEGQKWTGSRGDEAALQEKQGNMSEMGGGQSLLHHGPRSRFTPASTLLCHCERISALIGVIKTLSERRGRQSEKWGTRRGGER